MNYILLHRSKPQPVTQHMDVVESIITQARIEGKDTDECKATIMKRGTVLVMPQDLFLDYAIRNYRLDVVGSMKQRDCHSINDILRLFSVMAMNDHRADVLSLPSHKVSNRSQMDQAFGREDMIFLQISKDFNNSSVQVQPPKLFHTLTEKVTMNPNAISDSQKYRSPKWLKQLYKSIMSEYKVSMKKWTSGTGGGSGAPKDYWDWNKRDVNTFGDYGGRKGSKPVRKSYLAYLLMVDMDVGYVCFYKFFSGSKRQCVQGWL